jgi:hypothetical protein
MIYEGNLYTIATCLYLLLVIELTSRRFGHDAYNSSKHDVRKAEPLRSKPFGIAAGPSGP